MAILLILVFGRKSVLVNLIIDDGLRTTDDVVDVVTNCGNSVAVSKDHEKSKQARRR